MSQTYYVKQFLIFGRKKDFDSVPAGLDKVLVGIIFINWAVSLKFTHIRICREGDIIFCLDGISQYVSGDSLQKKTLNLLEWDIGRVSDWTSEWVRRPLRGYHTVFQLSSPSDSKGEQGTNPIDFFFINEGNFRNDEGNYIARPTLAGEFLFPTPLFVLDCACISCKQYQTRPDQTISDQTRGVSSLESGMIDPASLSVLCSCLF